MSLSRKQTKDRVLLFGTEMNYLLEAKKKKQVIKKFIKQAIVKIFYLNKEK